MFFFLFHIVELGNKYHFEKENTKNLQNFATAKFWMHEILNHDNNLRIPSNTLKQTTPSTPVIFVCFRESRPYENDGTIESKRSISAIH